jgi:hypothetical protein
MSQGYYFSYSYDLTLSKQASALGAETNVKFLWNRNLLRPIMEGGVSRVWALALIQGYIGYFSTFIAGKKLDFYLLARRSSFRGGTRYLARGIDDRADVANFVELEQII